MRLPDPMLARSGPLPTAAGWAFEIKLDGFRALVDTHDGLRVRSRRGWNMTPLLPELARLPEGLQLDGELVAWDSDGRPDFHLLSRRMLHGDRSVRVCFVAFDVLAIGGEDTTRESYARRRVRLEALALDSPAWKTAPTFADGEALYAEVVRRRLEGVMAKRLRDPYRSGERGWLKKKNPNGPRFAEEREAAIRLARKVCA